MAPAVMAHLLISGAPGNPGLRLQSAEQRLALVTGGFTTRPSALHSITHRS